MMAIGAVDANYQPIGTFELSPEEENITAGCLDKEHNYEILNRNTSNNEGVEKFLTGCLHPRRVKLWIWSAVSLL